MNYSWILITVFAALAQTVRLGGQKHLKSYLDNYTITWIRSGFGLPVVALCIIVFLVWGYQFPHLNERFWIYASISSVAQIFGTLLLIILFSHRNFSIGVSYAKSEALQAALLSFVLFGTTIPWQAFLIIFIGVIGVMLISVTKQGSAWYALVSGIFNRTTLIGISSGTCFAITALFARKAILSLGSGKPFFYALCTLFIVLSIQTVSLGTYILIKDRSCFSKLKSNFKWSVFVGVTSALGSIAWFTAFALQHPAYVKTIGQIEIIFCLFMARKVFKERTSVTELIGIALLGFSVIALVLLELKF